MELTRIRLIERFGGWSNGMVMSDNITKIMSDH